MPPLKSKSKTAGKQQKAEEAKQETQLLQKKKKNEKNSESKTTKVANGKQHKSKGESPSLEKRKAIREGNGKSRTHKDIKKRVTAPQDTKPPAETGNRPVNGKAAKPKVKKTSESCVKTKGGTNKAGKIPAAPQAVKTKVGPPSRSVKGQSSETGEDESESDRGSQSERDEDEDSKHDEEEEEEEEEPGSNEEQVETQGSSEGSGEEEAEVSDSQKGLKRDTEGPAAGEESDKEESDKEDSVKEDSVKEASVKEDSVKEESDKELSEGVEKGSDTEEGELAEEGDGEEVQESAAAASDSSSSSSGGEEIRTGSTPEKQTTDKEVRRRRGHIQRPPEPLQRQRSRMFKKTKADKEAEKAEKARAKAEKQRAEKEAKQKAKEEKKNKTKNKNKKPAVRAEPEEVLQPPGAVSPNKIEAARSKARLLRLANQTKNIKRVNRAPDTDPDEDDEEEEEAKSTLLQAAKSRNQLMILKAKSKNLRTGLQSKPAKEGQSEAGDELSVNPNKEASEGESKKRNERLIAQRKGVATLRRVSCWINKKIPKSMTMRSKMLAWSKVISVSNWLPLRALKNKEGTRKSKGNFLKHTMALRVASKTGLARRRDRRSKEKGIPQGQAGEGGDEASSVGDKELEAKYAVVLPRMNKRGVAKADPVASTPTNSTVTPGSSTPSIPKPPKPGARLVLPVKPDLSLLKRIKKPMSGGSTASGESTEGGTDSGVGATAAPTTPEGSSDTEVRSRRAAQENQAGISVLQAARGKLGTHHLKLTKTSLPSGGSSPASRPTRPRGPDSEREAAAAGPRSTAEAVAQNRGAGRVGVGATYEEEADQEVAQLMCDDEARYTVGPPEVHWAGGSQMCGDPRVRTNE